MSSPINRQPYCEIEQAMSCGIRVGQCNPIPVHSRGEVPRGGSANERGSRDIVERHILPVAGKVSHRAVLTRWGLINNCTILRLPIKPSADPLYKRQQYWSRNASFPTQQHPLSNNVIARPADGHREPGHLLETRPHWRAHDNVD